MNELELLERLDFIEFRQELLFENTGLSRLLFQYGVNRKQYEAIMDLMDEYRELIKKGHNVSHASFEQKIYEIVPEHKGDYHFVESLAQEFHRLGRWTEVFETLYGGMQKFKNYLENPEK